MGLVEGRRTSRRQYFRVGTRLSIRHRRLAADEVDACCLELEAAERDPSVVDGPVGAHLARLEAKLDELLALVAEGQNTSVSKTSAQFERRAVEISGAGLRMETPNPPPVGSAIWLEFRLPGSARLLNAVGIVQRRLAAATPGANPEVAVAFRAIRDADRQAIVYFALESERSRLRREHGPRIDG